MSSQDLHELLAEIQLVNKGSGGFSSAHELFSTARCECLLLNCRGQRPTAVPTTHHVVIYEYYPASII